jgi:hypothetical protein
MRPGDERFSQRMVDLSSRLGDRLAERPAVDPVTALRNREAALKALDRAQGRKFVLVLGGCTAALAAVVFAWGAARFDAWGGPDFPAVLRPVTARAQSAVVAPSVILPASSPSEPVRVVSSVPPWERESLAIEATTVPAPDAPPVPAALARHDVAELQRLLAALGFDPGPIDGAAGPRTREAVMRYQEARGLSATGAPDRGLLRRLREDPAPRIAVASGRPPDRAGPPRRGGDAGVFEPIRLAGRQITDWLNAALR